MADLQTKQAECPVCQVYIDCLQEAVPCGVLTCRGNGVEGCQVEELKRSLDAFAVGDDAETPRKAVVMNCQHVIHAICLREWLDVGANRCPICQRPVAPESAGSGVDLRAEREAADNELARQLQAGQQHIQPVIQAPVVQSPTEVHSHDADSQTMPVARSRRRTSFYDEEDTPLKRYPLYSTRGPYDSMVTAVLLAVAAVAALVAITFVVEMMG